MIASLASSFSVTLAADDMAAYIGGFLGLMIAVVIIAGAWKVFTKAGQPGWAVLIPIYNYYIVTKIAGRPWWWLLLAIVPIVNIIVAVVLLNDVSKSFGRGIGTTLGLIFLPAIFYVILGFGDAQYQGPSAG